MIVVPEIFTTPRLRLRPSLRSDAPAVFELGSDLEVARYMDWPALKDLRDAILATERAEQQWKIGDRYTWRITITPHDIPIGNVGCHIAGRQAELGFVLSRRQWGQGFATEASRVVFEWLASEPAISRIQATCDVDNAASQRVLEKLGMTREAILPQSVVRPNLPGRPMRDALLYAWVREA